MKKLAGFITGFIIVAIIAGYYLWVDLRSPSVQYSEQFVQMPAALTQSGALTKLLKGLKFYNTGATAISSKDIGKSNPFSE